VNAINTWAAKGGLPCTEAADEAMANPLARPPTPLHLRSQAMVEYVAGEALCDDPARVAEGLQRLRRSMMLAWEISGADWPGWATAMYDRLVTGGPPDMDAAAPILGADTAWLQPAISSLAFASSAGNWWRHQPAVHAICAALCSHHFAVIDHFLDREVCAALRRRCVRAWHDGLLKPAKVAEPGDAYGGAQSPHTRSDCMAWVDPGFGYAAP